jgi:hypothetical protein
MELSENLKLLIDLPAGENQHDKPVGSSNNAIPAPAEPIDDAESQMRKALGLLGDAPRHRTDADRGDSTSRIGDRFGGGAHRRRFVQDGDVPVTVLRRDSGHETPVHRSATNAAAPSSNRLQRTEASLAAETAAREKAERLLTETQAIVRDLQTKIGHAELAKSEAIEALRQEREAASQHRTDAEAYEVRLQQAQLQAQAAEDAASGYQEQLLEERQARKAAEKALRNAEAAREVAEQLVKTLSEEVPEQPKLLQPRASVAKAVQARDEMPLANVHRGEKVKTESVRRPRPMAEPEVVAATARRGRAPLEEIAEPEPVKWWLNAKPATKRR